MRAESYVHFGVMDLRNRLRLGALVLVVFLAGCSGSDDAGHSESPEPFESTTTIDTEEPDETDEAPTVLSAEEEAAVDQLDLVLLQLGTTELVATADCVVERLKSEDVEITGQGAPELVAALRCEPALSARLFNAEAFGFPQEQSSCIVDRLGEATAAVPLAEAEAYFSTPTPPDAVIQAISAVCGVSVDELTASFS